MISKYLAVLFEIENPALYNEIKSGCLCVQDEWALFMVTKKRTTKLKMTEFEESFSEDHADGTEVNVYSSYLYFPLSLCLSLSLSLSLPLSVTEYNNRVFYL